MSDVEIISFGEGVEGNITIRLNDDAYSNGIRIVDLSGDDKASGNNTIDVSNESGATNGFALIGSDYADTITGGACADTITGGAGADTIDGGGGDDEFIYRATNELFSGGALIDAINGGSGQNAIVFNAGGTSVSTAVTDDFSAGVSNVQTIKIGEGTDNNIAIRLNNNAFDNGIRTVNLSGDDVNDGGTNRNTIDVSAETDSSSGFTLIGS